MNDRRHLQVDCELLENDKISREAVLLYAEFCRRHKQSKKKGMQFYDQERQKYYIYYKRSDICKFLHRKKQVASNTLHELELHGLVQLYRIKRGPYRIYVTDLPPNIASVQNRETIPVASKPEQPWKEIRPPHHDRAYVCELLKEIVNYDWLYDHCRSSDQQALLKMVIDIMTNVWSGNANTYKIGSNVIYTKDFVERFSHLKSEHIMFVIDNCAKAKMTHPRQYVLRCLFSAKEDYEASLIGLID